MENTQLIDQHRDRFCREFWYWLRGGVSHDLLGSEKFELLGD